MIAIPVRKRCVCAAAEVGPGRAQQGVVTENRWLACAVIRHPGAERRTGQQRADGLQHDVAGLVTPGVVDALEMVDIQHGQGQRLVLVLAARQHAGQHLVQMAAIEQAGQRIAHRLRAQPFPQFDVGQRQLDALAHRDRQGPAFLGLSRVLGARRGNVQQSERAPLHNQRYAEGACGGWSCAVGTAGPVSTPGDLVHLPQFQRDAPGNGKLRRQQPRLAPGGDGAEPRRVRVVGDGQRARAGV